MERIRHHRFSWGLGAYLATIEINRSIALILKQSHVMPAADLSALGMVLVAKGIVRFQQLDDRDFAEYVLIGTLLSIFAAKSLLSPL
ncbi:MAG: hypothetical protein ACOCW6_05740 [Spirochaetota bacterium]